MSTDMSSDPALGPLFLESSNLRTLGWFAYGRLTVTNKQYSYSLEQCP